MAQADNDPQYDPDDPIIRTAVFGKQVEDFLTGDIGEYLVKRAKNEIDNAVEKLKKINPRANRSIQTLQNQIKVCESIAGWLGDAVISGQQAMKVIEGKDE